MYIMHSMIIGKPRFTTTFRFTLLLILLCSMLLLTACTSKPDNLTIDDLKDAFQFEDIKLSDTNKAASEIFMGVKPNNYKLENDETVSMYIYDSNDKHELGYKQLQTQQLLQSSYAPIIYKVKNALILYHYKVFPKTQTAKLTETEYGVAMDKALKRLNE